MTAPAPAVGSAYVRVKVMTDNVKRDITNGIKAGWADANKAALKEGRSTGLRYARGFKAGLKQGRPGEAVDAIWEKAHRSAGLAGAKAGKAYADNYNRALRRNLSKSSAPAGSSSEASNGAGTKNQNPRTGGGGGGGGALGGGGGGRTSITNNVMNRHTVNNRNTVNHYTTNNYNTTNYNRTTTNNTVNNTTNNTNNNGNGGSNGSARPAAAPRPTPGSGGGSGGGDDGGGAAAAAAPRKPVKQVIKTFLDDNATRVLQRSLQGVMVSLQGIAVLSKAAMMALAAGTAIAGLSEVVALLGEASGILLMMPSLAVAVAAPVAAIKIGMKGVGEAFKASADNGENAAAVAKAVAAAQKQLVSAQRQVIAAEEALESAHRGVASAEKGVEAAARAHERAREGVTDAIDGQIEKLQDLDLQLKGAALDEEDAVLGVERARERLANMPKGSTSLDYREATLGLKQAQQRLDEVRESNEDMRKEAAKTVADGVEGSREVIDARQAEKDATDGVADAQQGLADAQKNVIKAQEGVADALAGVQEAMEGIAEAANSGTVDEFQKALAKLAPSAQDFVLQAKALGPAWEDVQKTIQGNLFNGLGDTLTDLANNILPVLKSGLGGVATSLNNVVQWVSKAFTAPDAAEKFGMVLDRIATVINDMAPGFFALAGVFKNLVTVGSEFFEGFGVGFTEGAIELEKWSMNFDGIRGTIDKARDALSTLWGVAKNIGAVLDNVFNASLPAATTFMSVLSGAGVAIEALFNGGEGESKLIEFFANVSEMLEALGPAIPELLMGIVEVGTMLTGLGADIAPGLTDFITGLREGLNNLQPMFDVLGPKISTLFSTLGEHMPQLGDTVSAVGEAFGPLIDTLTWLVDHVGPPLMSLIEWMAPIIGPLVPILLGFAAGWKAISIGMGLFNRAESGVSNIMGRLRGDLDGQTKKQDEKEGSTRDLTDSQDDLQTAERETDDTIERTTAEIRDNTEATRENNDATSTAATTGAPGSRSTAATAVRDNFRRTAPEESSTSTTAAAVRTANGGNRFRQDAPTGAPVGAPARFANNDELIRTTVAATSSLVDQSASSRSSSSTDDEDAAPASRRSRVAAGAVGAATRAAGAGAGALSIGTAVAELGGEDGVAGALTKVTDTMTAIKEGNFMEAFGGIGEIQESIGGISEGLGQLKDSFSGVTDGAKNAWNGLKESGPKIKDGFGKAKDVVSSTGGKLKDAVGAMKNWNITAKISQGITKVWTVIQAGFNLVMSMNPIALVVLAIAGLIAALVIAYQKSETFRNIVQSVWEAIKVGALFVWENVLKPVFEFIVAGLQRLGDFFAWVWNSLIKPAWDALGIGIGWVWENVIRPAWDALKLALQAVGDFFSWVWNSIIKPAWDALGAGIGWVWENIIRPAWDGLKIALEILGNFFRDTWNNVIKPAWDALGEGIRWVWENVVKKAFDALKDGLTGVKDWFGSMVNTIEELWGKIVDIVKKPVRFVIDTVYNNGIVKAWNGIAGLIGMDSSKLEPMSLEGFATGGVPDRKKGGVESGYSPGRDDRIIAVGGGEAIMRPEFTRAVGVGYVNKVNAAARNGGVRGVQEMLNNNPNIPRFNKGGPVDLGAAPWTGGGGEANLQPAAILARRNIHKYWPEIQTIGGYRAQDAYRDHPSGLALDTMTFDPAGTQVNDWLHEQKDALALNYTIWKQFYKPAGGGGNMMEDRGDPTQNHMDHIHSLFNANGVAGIEAGGEGSDNGGGFWDSVVGAIRGSAAWGFKNVMKPIRAMVEKATDLGGGLFGEIPLKLFDKINGAAETFIAGKDPGGSSQGGNSDWVPSAGAEQWRQMVIDAYKNQGYESTSEKINAWVRQIDTESGGDPNIAQQIVDSNGTGEAAGVGLGQMIPGTWDAYRDPALPNNRRDPWAMINAMVRYGERKYGSGLTNMIGQGHGYDSGGWLQPGTQVVHNSSGKPEPVFSAGQWDVLKQGLNWEGANKYVADNSKGWEDAGRSWAVDAFKEITGGFTSELGIEGIINKAVDEAVTRDNENRANRDAAVAAGVVEPNKIADTMIFNGVDANKAVDEMTRAAAVGMGPSNGRYRGEN